ncbi:MAG: hypothetical protein Q9202_004748 [Teloschistes flavicans]
MVGYVPTLITVTFAITIIWYLYGQISTYISRRRRISARGCEPPARYPFWDPIFGLDVVYDAIRAIKRKAFLSEKQSHYEAYGNTHSSRLTTYPVISTIEPENIKAVLSTNFKDFEIGSPRRRAFSPILANSILVADGPEWEHSRAFLKPSFSRSQVGDLATLESHVQHLLKAIPRDMSTVDLADLFFRYTADVTTDFMFGESIGSLPRPEEFGGDMAQACRDVQLGAERRFRLGIFASVVPQPAFYRSVDKVHAYMNEHVEKALQRRKLQEGADDEQRGAKDSAPGRFVFSEEMAKLTSDRFVLRDQLGGIFFAGRDTTATLLSNLFFVLAREPEVWQQLHEEIATLNGKIPTLDELKQLRYLGFCLNETLRLYPIVQGTSRVALRDLILPTGGGPSASSPIFVAKGTLVIFHLFALHKRKDLWGEDAEDFRPMRWQGEKASWNFLPFGGGPRNCIGQQFALTEASYTAVRLLQTFKAIEMRDPRPWMESIGATCSNANGVKVAMVA